MTLEEAREIAQEVLANKTRSHVQAARALAEFVLGLPSPRDGDDPDQPSGAPA